MLEVTTFYSVSSHHLFLDSEGYVYGFGDNSAAQLGQEPYVPNITQIMQLSVPAEIVCVEAGCNQSYFIDTEGSVWVCGENGDSAILAQSRRYGIIYTPTKLTNLPPIQAVFPGTSFTLFLDYEGGLWGCGKCRSMCLESQTVMQINKLPMKVKGLCIAENSFALILDQEGYLWKSITFLTNDAAENLQKCTTRKYVALTRTNEHALVLDENGGVWSYGTDGFGQCGTQNAYQLEKIPNIPPITQIQTGEYHSAILDIDGCVWTFGKNLQHQLGVGNDYWPEKRPVMVENLPKITKIYCGTVCTVAIDEEGVFWIARKSNSKPSFVKAPEFPIMALQRKISTKSARNCR